MQTGHKFPRHWTLPAAFFTVFFVYFVRINVNLDRPLTKSPYASERQDVKQIEEEPRTIVSYSLLKRIELDGEEHFCEEQSKQEYNHEDIKGPSKNHTEEDIVWTIVEGTDLYVLSARSDARLDPYHYLRIIGMIKGNSTSVSFCRFASNGTYRFIKASVKMIWSNNWDKNDRNTYYNPVLISCRVPERVKLDLVALTSQPCDSSQKSNLKVEQSKNKDQKRITVCVKPLDFTEDISYRLIQWIEMVKVLGADRIEFFVKTVTPRVHAVLKWYSTSTSLDVSIRPFRPLQTDENFPKKLWQKRRYEIATYNDCFYRNIHDSEYVVPLDIDEIIVPRRESNWHSFLDKHLFGDYSSISVPNAFYFMEKRRHLVYFFENIARTDYSPDGEFGKSFISTKNTLTVFNHYALEQLKPGIEKTYFISPSIVQTNHYKDSCDAEILPECVKYVFSPKVNDSIIFRFRRRFEKGYDDSLKVLKNLDLL